MFGPDTLPDQSLWSFLLPNAQYFFKAMKLEMQTELVPFLICITRQ